MPLHEFPPPLVDNPINSRQLAMIRWIAILGQLLAVIITHVALGYKLPLATCLAVIALAGLVGIIQHAIHRKQTQMNNNEAFAILGFDTVQLFLLLYLTGGLTNPFSILFLAPVTVSASLLPIRKTFMLVTLVAVLASLLSFSHQPLPWNNKPPILPMPYLAGLWIALVLATVFIAAYIGLLAGYARQMTRGLAEARLAMAREHKMMSLGSLATAAAHKLSSPLNTITLISHELGAMLEDGSSKQELAREIEALNAETERCRQILAGLDEEVSQIDQMSEDPVIITTLIQSLVDDRFADIREMIAVHSHGAGQVPILTKRPDILYSLDTIIDNAAHFAAQTIRVDIDWDDRWITIAVRDDGSGFPPAILSRIGQPYNSSRKDKDGHMGLGLFIAMTMIERLGGWIKVENASGGGGMVSMVLPRREFDAAGTQQR